MTSTHRQASNKSKRPKTHDSTPTIISKIKGQWGGRRANSGGSREGSGRPQRQPTPLPPDTDLKSSVGIDKFLCEVIKRFLSENVLDARALSSLNSTIKLLLQNRNWLSPEYPAWDDPIDYEKEIEDREENNDDDSGDELEKTLNLLNQIQTKIQKREQQPQQKQPQQEKTNGDQQQTRERQEELGQSTEES
jgi:hypothetical protein